MWHLIEKSLGALLLIIKEQIVLVEVFAALGAKPFVPPIKGVEHSITAEEALMDIESVGKKVTVIGGGQVGAETALWLAQRGHEVTIVEALPEYEVWYHLSRGYRFLKCVEY